jgi:hypothetical protein
VRLPCPSLPSLPPPPAQQPQEPSQAPAQPADPPFPTELLFDYRQNAPLRTLDLTHWAPSLRHTDLLHRIADLNPTFTGQQPPHAPTVLIFSRCLSMRVDASCLGRDWHTCVLLYLLPALYAVVPPLSINTQHPL